MKWIEAGFVFFTRSATFGFGLVPASRLALEQESVDRQGGKAHLKANDWLNLAFEHSLIEIGLALFRDCAECLSRSSARRNEGGQ